jgi:hypothetical protein
MRKYRAHIIVAIFALLLGGLVAQLRIESGTSPVEKTRATFSPMTDLYMDIHREQLLPTESLPMKPFVCEHSFDEGRPTAESPLEQLVANLERDGYLRQEYGSQCASETDWMTTWTKPNEGTLTVSTLTGIKSVGVPLAGTLGVSHQYACPINTGFNYEAFRVEWEHYRTFAASEPACTIEPY